MMFSYIQSILKAIHHSIICIPNLWVGFNPEVGVAGWMCWFKPEMDMSWSEIAVLLIKKLIAEQLQNWASDQQ